MLASASSIRSQLLANAGLLFQIDAAGIDEKATLTRLRAGSSGPAVADLAKALAGEKALHVSARHPGAVVIGADQMLDLDGEIVAKAATVEAARGVLMQLRGRAHKLHSGVALANGGQVIWSAVQTATLQMRPFSDDWLLSYMAENAGALTDSVGAYQLEGPGVQLFECIEGDYFTILGLPLLPLLAALRREGVITS